MLCILGGLFAGICSIIFGTGGGMIIVPILVKLGLTRREAHANAIVVVSVLSLIGSIIVFMNKFVVLNEIILLGLWCILGSVLGAFVLNKINQVFLRKLFACFSVWAGIRMIRK
ncbi:MAG: sulfite exporter TauE/SafE family protein [Candidatus Improbicoccus devescovinae]|nr:MAG: sulfite exporter TauE/SafE family protein [Candidatus Improbicoccus devescovinae]